jgi:hypothetical protein
VFDWTVSLLGVDCFDVLAVLDAILQPAECRHWEGFPRQGLGVAAELATIGGAASNDRARGAS